MSKRAVSSVAALALLGGATLAAAQGFDRGGPGDVKGGAQAPPVANQPAPQKQSQPPRIVAPEAPAAKAPRGAEERTGKGTQGGPDREERRGAVRERAPEQRRASEPERAKDRKQAGEKERQGDQPKAAERERRQEQQGAAEREKQKNAEQEKRQAAEREKQRNAAERERGSQQPKTAEPDRAHERPNGQRTAKQEQLRQERNKLSEDQRMRVRRAFLESRNRVAKLNVNARIGVALPRRVALYAVPAAVVSIFPYYRDYRYVLVEDTICIVDPATYEIVDVIDEGPYAPGDRPRTAELTLSERESRIVLDSIPPDFPTARLQLRLALGATIPETAELFEFAPLVLDRVPKLRDYRFLVTDDQVVIVAPRDRSIALAIDR